MLMGFSVLTWTSSCLDVSYVAPAVTFNIYWSWRDIVGGIAFPAVGWYRSGGIGGAEKVLNFECKRVDNAIVASAANC
jgi:hypothetical protein